MLEIQEVAKHALIRIRRHVKDECIVELSNPAVMWHLDIVEQIWLATYSGITLMNF